MATKEELLAKPKRISAAGIEQYGKATAEREMKSVAEVKPAHMTEKIPGSKTEFSYEDIYRRLAGEPETAEDRAKLERKRKRDELFAAIGDGVSALSNLFFATKGAPNMYDGNRSMSEKTRVRYDRMMKDRDAKRSAWYSGLMKARLADEAKAQADREWKRKLALDAEKQKQDKILGDLKIQLQQGKVSEQEYKAAEAKVKAGRADEVQQSIIARNRAAAGASEASAAKNSAKEFKAYDSDGVEHLFYDEDAAEAFARQHGTWVETTSNTTVDRVQDPDSKFAKKTTTTTTKPSGGYSKKPSKAPNWGKNKTAGNETDW